MATGKSLVMRPPAMLRCFVLPHAKEMTRLIQARGASVRPHCHGRMRHMLDMILGTDGDGIDPCEPSPAGDRSRTNPTAYDCLPTPRSAGRSVAKVWIGNW